MANSDYIIREASGALCPVAEIAAALAPLDTQVAVTGFESTGPNDTPPGMVIMIGDELCKLIAKTGNLIEFQRGCGDTIPRAHPAGELVWFLDDATMTDGVDYGGTDTIAVKVLPATAAGATVPVAGSPPNDVTFGNRFLRPYPPGAVQANAFPWFEGDVVIDEITDLVLTWAHRDRIGQAGSIITHEAASVGPEPGTTYTITVFDTTNAIRAVYAGIDAETWTYTQAMVSADFMSELPITNAYLLLRSVRGGYESLDAYRIDFAFEQAVPYGLGYRLGESLGGVTP